MSNGRPESSQKRQHTSHNKRFSLLDNMRLNKLRNSISTFHKVQKTASRAPGDHEEDTAQLEVALDGATVRINQLQNDVTNLSLNNSGQQLGRLLSKSGCSDWSQNMVHRYEVRVYEHPKRLPSKLKKMLLREIRAWFSKHHRNATPVSSSMYISDRRLQDLNGTLELAVVRADDMRPDNRPLLSEHAYKAVRFADMEVGRTQVHMVAVNMIDPEDTNSYLSSLPPQTNQESREVYVQRVARLPPRAIASFYVWIEYYTINLLDVSQMVQIEDRRDHDRRRNLMNKLVGSRLTEIIINAGSSDLVRHGNSVYAEPKALTNGAEVRRGLKGKLTVSSNLTLQLSWKPREAYFLQSILVSDFLLAYCGPEAMQWQSPIASPRLLDAADVLKGTFITVAVSADMKRKTYVACGLGPSVITDSRALRGTILKNRPLKYLDMPSVNVGSEDNPFCFPAEMCKIHANQPLKFEPPLSAYSSKFEQRQVSQQRRRRLALPPAQNVFKDVRPTQFELFFFRLKHQSSEEDARRSVDVDAWEAFKFQMGERFGGRLRIAVQKPIDKCIGSDDVLDTMEIVEEFFDKSITPVIVVVAPRIAPREIINVVKERCDLHLGVQCSIVNATEIEKRYNALMPDQMIKYTGQIVRRIFARASIPGVQDEDPSASAQGKPHQAIVPTGQGLFAGVHVFCVKDECHKATYSDPPDDLERYYQLSVVSARTSRNHDLRVTHHLQKLDDGDDGHDAGHSVATMVADAFAGHLITTSGSATTDLTHIAIWLNGTNLHIGEHVLQRLGASMKHSPLGNAYRMIQISLTTIRPETMVTIPPTEHTVHISNATTQIDKLTGDRSKRRELSQIQDELRNTFNLERTALAPLFRQQASGLASNEAPWHVTYHQMMSSRQVAARFGVRPMEADKTASVFTTHVCLERRSLPEIVYLAQRASKRARLHLRKTEGVPEIPYVIDDVHNNLKHILYFL